MSQARRLPARIRRRIEQASVLLFLAATGFSLWRGHDLIAWSDPAGWFDFGRHFFERFGTAPLAYGFPLLVQGSLALVGPLWAFLVNLPVLLVMVGLVYALARSLMPGEPGLHARLGPFAGGVAVALLWLRNQQILVDLVSPYRDPLAHVFSLLSCLLLLHYFRKPGRPLGWVAAAGASLALGVSTRETGALLLGPFALYAWALRGRFPLRRATTVFFAVFAVACVPMWLHNHGVSGRFWIPAQAASHFASSGSLTPGVEAEHMTATLPRALSELWRPLGWVSAALLLAGLVSGLRRRQASILALCVPSIAIYLLFYGSYQRPVTRYLFTVDLFAMPLAGAGAAALLHALIRPLGVGRPGRSLAVAAGAAAAVGAALVAFDSPRAPAHAFRLEHARALRDHIEALVPVGAPLLGDYPIATILRSFVERNDPVRVFKPRRVFSDSEQRDRIRETVGDADEAYFVYQPGPLKTLMRSEFDFELVASFRSSAYGLAKPKLIQDSFHLARLRSWTEFEATRAFHGISIGRHLLAVDVGRLSSQARGSARLFWNGEALDTSPEDGINFHVVDVEGPAAEARVRLRSDAPVPTQILAELRPLQWPVVMKFDPDELLNYQSLLAGGFVARSGSRLPMLVGKGTIEVPTPDWRHTLFVGVAEVEVQSSRGDPQLTIGIADRPFYRVALQIVAPENPRGEHTARVSFAFLEPVVRGDLTVLHWDYADPAVLRGDPALGLRSLIIHRHALEPTLDIDVGGGQDDAYVVDGLLAPRSRSEPLPLRYRWTRQRAELRLAVALDPRPARLQIRHYETRRPEEAPRPEPIFKLNGAVLGGGREQRRPAGELEEVTTSFELRPGTLNRVINHMVLRSNAWKDRGVMLDRVWIERIDGGR